MFPKLLGQADWVPKINGRAIKRNLIQFLGISDYFSCWNQACILFVMHEFILQSLFKDLFYFPLNWQIFMIEGRES